MLRAEVGAITLLVEGATDKRAMFRALRKLETDGRIASDSVYVDSAHLIDVSEACVGNRERVEVVHAAARAAGYAVFALTDREFRDFATSPVIKDERPSHRQVGSVFWTRGHSIENYFFEPSYAASHLLYRHSDAVSPAMLQAIDRYWKQLLCNAAALSIAARDNCFLKKLRGALTTEAWILVSPGFIGLSADALEKAITLRGEACVAAGAFASSFRDALAAMEACPDAECARWIAHGHLADEVLWLAIGRILQHEGAPPEVVHDVAVGHKEDKAFNRADRWGEAHAMPIAVPTPVALWQAVGARV